MDRRSSRFIPDLLPDVTGDADPKVYLNVLDVIVVTFHNWFSLHCSVTQERKTMMDKVNVALNIKDSEADRLARELAASTGETLTEAELNALRERIAPQKQERSTPRNARETLREARLRLTRLPVLDNRSFDEIVGYNETGGMI